ncbi:adenylate kinase [Arcanobacterium canis]|uniref:Adenylate kinase n=1 Tax=Arcanobacterium canis TaxID=999183 RepID=A0ABY8G013_9ACTO|nr:adenylate kinase [Arcanobacterium canis]WFM83807.1 adenylate kinase [Arcanobacterium canis]
MTRLILVGPPGAGKGTQATFISEALSIPAISTGAIFRKNMSEGTELGKKAQEYTSKGNLVPDEITDAMVRDRLAQDDAKNGFLLDGYPRNLAQVDALDAMLAEKGEAIDVVVEIAIPDEDIVGRLLNRAKIEGRADDTEEVIKHRIEVYHAETAPLVDVYAKRGLVLEVDGNGSIEDVTERILSALKEHLA